MPTQVGQTRGVSDVPVFYVPGAGESFNVAAAFWQNYLGEKNKHAMPLYMARLKALDPSARAAAMNEAYANQTARIKALNARFAEGEKTKRTMGPEILRFYASLNKDSTSASIARFKGETDIAIAGTTLKSDKDKEFAALTGKLMEDYQQALETGDAGKAQSVREMLEGRMLEADSQFGLEGANRRAYDNIIVDKMRALGLSAEEVTELAPKITRARIGADKPIAPPGGGGFASVTRRADEALRGIGAEGLLPHVQGTEEAVSRSVSGTAPVAPTPVPAGDVPYYVAPPDAPAEATQTTPARDDPYADIKDYIGDPGAAIEGAYGEKPYGDFGDPLPGYTRPDRKGKLAQRFAAEADPESLVDFLQGMSAVSRGERSKKDKAEAMKGAVSETRRERKEVEEQNRPVIATPVSEGRFDEGVTRSTWKELRKAKQAKRRMSPEDEAEFVAGEMSLDEVLEPPGVQVGPVEVHPGALFRPGDPLVEVEWGEDEDEILKKSKGRARKGK